MNCDYLEKIMESNEKKENFGKLTKLRKYIDTKLNVIPNHIQNDVKVKYFSFTCSHLFLVSSTSSYV